jgi:hypothetical protein
MFYHGHTNIDGASFQTKILKYQEDIRHGQFSNTLNCKKIRPVNYATYFIWYSEDYAAKTKTQAIWSSSFSIATYKIQASSNLIGHSLWCQSSVKDMLV